jgi:hypothetical protein
VAPTALDEIGETTVEAEPVESVSTVVGLTTARGVDTANVTIVPAIGAPVASFTSAVTVPGAEALMMFVGLMLRTTDAEALDTTPVVPVGSVVPEPEPKDDAPGEPPPPPHAAKLNALSATQTHLHIVIEARLNI